MRRPSAERIRPVGDGPAWLLAVPVRVLRKRQGGKVRSRACWIADLELSRTSP
jgi:hypothetical protein